MIITPPRIRGGVIFSFQFACVCLSVQHFLWTKFQPNGCTDLDAVFAKWLLTALALSLLKFVTSDDFWLKVKVTLTLVAVRLVTLRNSKKGNCPPGPRGVPILGYLPFFGKEPPVTFLKLRKVYQYHLIYILFLIFQHRHSCTSVS